MISLFSRIRGWFYRITAPLFMKRVGRGTAIWSVRLARPLTNVSIGKDCMIGVNVFIQTGRQSEIEIGDNTSLNTSCHIVAGEKISIGSNVAIGEFVSIRDQEYNFTPSTGAREQGFTCAPIVIEDNVWIGRGVYIGPGTHIRRGTIVAANSVVKGDFPENVLLAGSPCQIKRSINYDGTLSELTTTKGNNL